MRLGVLVAVLLFAPSAIAFAGIDLLAAQPPDDAPRFAAAPFPGPQAWKQAADSAEDAASSSADAAYEIRFQCAGAGQDTAAATVACPSYVFDREDIMAQPVLLVDPRDANFVSFNAMHGGRGLHPAPGSEPPTERSRENAVHQPHTTFMSRDGGATWQDLPYHNPDAMNQQGRDVFGEDNAATLDADGRLYLASLYSYRTAGGQFTSAGSANYAIGVWKAKGLDKAVDYYANSKILAPADGSAVDSIFLSYVPGADVVVLVWRETPTDGAPFVQAYSTKPSQGALWTKVEATMPGCTAISNPIAVASTLFVGCRSETAWDVHALDATTWTTQKVDATPLDEPHATLVKRGDDGLMVLIGSGLGPDGTTPSVRIAYGELGSRWSSADEVGAKLSAASAAAPLMDARVTAAAFSPTSGNLHLIYMERSDPSRSAVPSAEQTEFRKVFASVQAEGAFQGLVDLQVGRISRADYSPTVTGVGGGAYDDLHDTILVVATATEGEKEFVAYGDYGFVRFAEVKEVNFLPPISPLGAPVPAVPLASGGIAPVVYGSAAGLLSGAMVVRTLLAKRKQAVEAPTNE